jgi:predicted O-methyltransferase YrrM
MQYLKPGGFIIADNTLWDGKVAEPEHKQSDRQTQGIVEFNRMVAHDPRVEVVIIPVRDGLTLIHKR